MSDMIQQPVIQLLQELTMTAVVEWHVCTVLKNKREEKKKKKKQQSYMAAWKNPFVIPPFLGKRHLYIFTETQQNLSTCTGTKPKTIFKRPKGREDLAVVDVERQPAFGGGLTRHQRFEGKECSPSKPAPLGPSPRHSRRCPRTPVRCTVITHSHTHTRTHMHARTMNKPMHAWVIKTFIFNKKI